MNKALLYRILFLFSAIALPLLLSWWLFVPIALLYVYLVKSPYEIVAAGLILDCVYYWGDDFLVRNALALLALALVAAVFFLESRVEWRRIM